MFDDSERQFLIDTVQQRIKWYNKTITETKKDGGDASSYEQSLKLGMSVIAKLDCSSSASTPSQAFAKPSHLRSKAHSEYRFLVVDDVSLMRTLLKEILLELGYSKIETVDSGSKALNELGNSDYDAVFCDWDMPGMTGLELVEEVRRTEKFKDLVFIMVTGMDNAKNIKDAVAAGVNDYIVKPVNAEVLEGKLKRLRPSKSR